MQLFTKQLIMTVKITVVLLLAVSLHVTARTMAQKVTLKVEKKPLKEVMDAISKQTGYLFFYQVRQLKQSTPVTIDIRNQEMKEVLKRIFAGQPFNYSIANKTIVLTAKGVPEKAIGREQAQPAPVQRYFKIHVTDSTGQPLAGAAVRIKGGNAGGTTDARGDVILSGLEGTETIVISYIGYEPKEVDIDNRETIITVLKAVTNPLDEMQVIAYGSDTKRFSVGSVGTVTAADIARQPVTNPLLALQGQVPGLAVTAMSGVPGATTLVQVRGQNSLGTAAQVKPYDQPLFIIDGVPFAPQNVNISQLNSLATQTFNGGISQPTGISPFSSINPNDIESITILKDATATSVYGSQGANGVILITTKKGKSGKTAFDVNVNSQFNYVARPVSLMNTAQYLQLRRDAFAADGVTPSGDPSDYKGFAPDLTIFDQDKYTDWAKIIAGKSTQNTDLHATVSGGSASNTFLVAAGYTRSNYNYPGDFSDQRYTLHSALHSASTNNRFTLDLVTDFGYHKNSSAGYGGSKGVLLAPNLPDLTDGAGNLIWNYKGYPLNVENFYSSLKQPTYLTNYNFNSSLRLSYKIIQGLSISANVGYSRNSTDERSENPASAQEPTYAVASAAFGKGAMEVLNIEPQINYTRSLGKGVLTALLGGTYKKTTNDMYEVEGYGYSNDNFLGSIIGATETYPSETINLIKYSAGFARLKYTYDQKYIVELSGRRDGSSDFGPGRQFGNFGSVGAGWIFSEERALKKALPVLSYGKLSGSYGTAGKDASKSYSYQALYQNLSSVPAFQGIKPAYPYNLYNPDYSWAEKKSLNLALDIGFFKDRLFLNATYYKNREDNQLVDYPLPIQTGFTGVFGNLSAIVQNKGWEFSATSTNIKGKSFAWTTNFNVTFNRNKLLDFPDLEASSYADKYIIGQPTSIITGYRYKGVNPATGLYEFYDKNGNATSSPKFGTAAQGGDQVPIGDMEVKYMGGIGNTLSYKNFSLYIFGQFSSSDAPNFLSALYNDGYPGGPVNLPEALLGMYWKASGDEATVQRLASSSYSGSFSTLAAFRESDAVLSNDTYFRIKTVSLSYQLPEGFIQKIHVKSGSIYVNAQNLFTITNYKVGDPEQPGTFTAFPLQRIVAIGLNIKF